MESEFTVNQEEAFFPVSPDWEQAITAKVAATAYTQSVVDATENLDDGPALTVVVNGRAVLAQVEEAVDAGKARLLGMVKRIMERNQAWEVGFVTEAGCKVQYVEGSKPSVKYDAEAIDNLLLALYANTHGAANVDFIIAALRAARQEVPGRAGSYRFTEVKK